MEIFNCLADETRSEGIGAALSALMAEHLVIFPTDTGYALAGDAFSNAASVRIRSIKYMRSTAPLQVLIGGTGVLDGVAEPAPEEARSLAEKFWPGPLTLVVPASPTAQLSALGDSPFLQIRMPNHPVAIELLSLSGPLVVSAARNTSSPLIESVNDLTDLQHHVAVFLDYGVIKRGPLSTIVDYSTGEAAVLRKGPITVGQLVDALGYMPRVLTSDQ